MCSTCAYTSANNIANCFLLIVDKVLSHPHTIEDWVDNIEIIVSFSQHHVPHPAFELDCHRHFQGVLPTLNYETAALQPQNSQASIKEVW